jgi:type IV secretory pathway protease TraF
MTLERFMLIISWLLLLCIVTLGYNGAVINATDSAPLGLYARCCGFPQRGSLVMFRPLIKRLVANPGDMVRTSPEGTYVNGELQPDSAIPQNTQGYRPYQYGIYILGPHQHWVLGTGNSLDSRYWGPVSDDDIATPIKSLWTLKSSK